ncbi:hypothetical protein pipiens_011799 [Culex pipiens pipiens]|uniref:ZAD domain-containing protein n=1 Tax=Culex pipiens pipiens TaxID=38569 RepID=A0ABD1D4U7_CULPP
MNLPCDDPLQYCRFCFTQFRVEPLLSGGQKDQQLVKQISSLVQIELDSNQATTAAICSMCRHQLTEFQLFRDRCKHHDSIVRDKVEGDQSSQNDMWFAVEPLGDGDDSDEDDTPMSKDDLRSVPVSEKQTKVNFWRAISRDVGVIPEHIQRDLELTGFYRNASLGMISPTTIKQIEQDMREAVEFVISQGANRAELKVSSRKEQLNASETPDNADTLAETLVEKIQDYYKQYTTDSREFKAFIARLPRQKEIDVRQKEDGSIFAFIHCSYCKKHLQAFVDSRWNVWRVYNFVKHTQKHYRVENIRSAKRKRAQGGGEDVIDESDNIHS